jgi:ferredoxin--NADP+ reductase
METPVLDPGRHPLGPRGPVARLAPHARLAPRAPRALLAGGLVEPRPIRRREVAPNATLVSRLDLTPSIARFLVRPDAGVQAFKPGQYFALGLEVDGTLLQRPYSTASPAGTTDEVELLIRRVNTGSFTPHLWKVAPGGRVWLGPPKGLFTLQPGDERTHLFVSTGTGLAPFVSMSETLLRSRAGADGTDGTTRNGPMTRPRIVVVHGVSYAAELAYRDRIEAWSAPGRLSYVPTLSRPADPANAGWIGATGRTETILDRVCDQLALDPRDTVAYICGNPEMIEAATATLARRGFPESAVIRELYWTATGPVE